MSTAMMTHSSIFGARVDRSAKCLGKMVVQPKEAEFLDACSLSRAEIIRLSQGSDKDRHDRTVPISQVTTAQVTALQPLTFVEHVACVIFLSFGVPNGVFTVPCVTYLIGWMAGNVGMAYKILLVLLLPLAILPQPFVPSTLSSWMAVSVLKYFSFRFAFEHKPEPPPKDGKNPRPQILVAPPHGVFPYG